jgi:hypothetical protein
MKVLFLFSALLSVAFSYGQQDSILVRRERYLSEYLDGLRKATTDAEKETANTVFKDYLLETIQIGGAFDYPFAQLKTLGSIQSPDRVFRMFNWNVEQDDESNKYYCFILHQDLKRKTSKVIELIDNSAMLPARPDDILGEDMWYGALYYKIIPVEKSGKTYYTLLGWDGNTNTSNIKLVDALYFAGTHIKLGSPIFKLKDGIYKRVFFEHSERSVMSLNYDSQRQRIIFDHLSPESPGMEGFYEYYVPDMSYDAMQFVNNKWLLVEDVIGVNGKDPKKITISYINPETGEVEEKSIKNTWVDPSNEGNPDGGQHVAAMPNEPIVEKEPETKPAEPAFPAVKKPKNPKEEFSTYPYSDMKKRKKKRK